MQTQIVQNKMKSEEVDKAIKNQMAQWNYIYSEAQKELKQNIESTS